jgi:hypothetical protein
VTRARQRQAFECLHALCFGKSWKVSTPRVMCYLLFFQFISFAVEHPRSFVLLLCAQIAVGLDKLRSDPCIVVWDALQKGNSIASLKHEYPTDFGFCDSSVCEKDRRCRSSDARVAAPVLFAHAHTLLQPPLASAQDAPCMSSTLSFVCLCRYSANRGWHVHILVPCHTHALVRIFPHGWCCCACLAAW